MFRRVVGYCVLIPTSTVGMFYADGGVVLPVLLFGFCAFAMVAIAWPELRRRRLVSIARVGGTVASAMVVVGWLISIIAYVQVPYGNARAIALDRGNVSFLSGLSVTGTPLRFEARWRWSGLTVGGPGGTGRWWLSWTGGATSTSYYWAIWPALVSIAVPTAVLWLLLRRKVPTGCCQECGYNLTGNVSGRCPECGTAVDAAR